MKGLQSDNTGSRSSFQDITRCFASCLTGRAALTFNLPENRLEHSSKVPNQSGPAVTPRYLKQSDALLDATKHPQVPTGQLLLNADVSRHLLANFTNAKRYPEVRYFGFLDDDDSFRIMIHLKNRFLSKKLPRFDLDGYRAAHKIDPQDFRMANWRTTEALLNFFATGDKSEATTIDMDQAASTFIETLTEFVEFPPSELCNEVNIERQRAFWCSVLRPVTLQVDVKDETKFQECISNNMLSNIIRSVAFYRPRSDHDAEPYLQTNSIFSKLRPGNDVVHLLLPDGTLLDVTEALNQAKRHYITREEYRKKVFGGSAGTDSSTGSDMSDGSSGATTDSR